MTASQQEIEGALLDVRKAYRLLHNYQRLALDAAKYIGAQLGFRLRAAGRASVRMLHGPAKAIWTTGRGTG